jgi:O-antigen ligase
LAGFIAFQCLSDKPAWRLLVDIDIVGGSTGYYRYQLIDEAIKHFSEWAPMGGNIDTTKWSPNLVDDANHYLMVALQGGMPLLTLFVIVISLAFASIGRARLRAGRDRALVIASWALGVSLFMHIMSFFSVFYFGQSVMLWDLTLAMIGSIRPTGKMMQSPPREISAPRRQFSAGPARVGAPLSATVWGK